MVIKPIGAVYRAFGGPTTARPTTDFFTTNPSLLHHLPRNPKLAIVQSGQAPTGGVESGTASGSSRQGWGAGSGGGYTGHARAFMALQHSAALDPSVALSYNAEEKRRRRNSLLAEHRLGRKTEVVDVESAESLGRTVHRQIEARAGSRRVGMVELEPSPRTEVRTLDEGTRASIPYPARSSTPYIGSVSRSHSSVEVWQVGIPASRRPSIRTMSTRSSTIALPELDVDEAVPLISRGPAPASTRVLGQPNRVLMDLAGLDLPGRPAASPRVLLVRRNSTAAIHQTPLDIGAQIHQSAKPTDEDISPAEVDAADKAFYTELYTIRKQETNFKRIYDLVQLYRTPRTNRAEMEVQALNLGLEAPVRYSTAVYNQCLSALYTIRRPGQSIQIFLEIYNEMLTNDCLPNLATYKSLILCLTARERDVWSAVEDYEYKKKWLRYRTEILGRPYDLELQAERDEIHEGYKQEGNFESAIRMFRAASLHRRLGEDLAVAMRSILDTAAMRENSQRDFEAAMEVYQAGVEAKVPGHQAWRGVLFEILAKRGDRAGLDREWEAFHDDWNHAVERPIEDWLEARARKSSNATSTPERRAALFQRRTWLRAAKAYLTIGDVDKAQQIWSMVQKSRNPGTEFTTSPPGSSRVTDLEFGLQLLEADPHVGMKFFAKHVFSRMRSPADRLEDSVYRRILHVLIKGDQLDLIRDRCSDQEFREAANVDLGTFLDLCAYTINKARSDPTAADRALWVYRQWCYSKKILLDMGIVRMHADVLQQLGRFGDIPRVLDAFGSATNMGSPEDRAARNAELLDWVRNVVMEWPIDFAASSRLLRRTANFIELPQDDALVIVMARKYTEHRIQRLSQAEVDKRQEAEVTTDKEDAEIEVETVKTGEGEPIAASSANQTMAAGREYKPGFGVLDLRLLLRLLSQYQAQDGELDDVLVMLANDMTDIAQLNAEMIDQAAHDSSMSKFARQLAYRVGEARAKELVLPFLGEFRASHWTTLPTTEPVLPVAVATPDLSQGETVSETGESSSSIETPSLDSAAADATARFGSGLRVSVKLGDDINRHTQRSAPINVHQAYDILKTRMATTGEVAPPEMIGRLLDNISRVNEEEKVRELYALSQHVITTLLVPQERLTAWASVENTMLIALCHLGHLEEAGACRARLLGAGQTPSADAYATMISSAKDTTDETHVARSMFDEARAMGVTPNLFLYNTIISKLSKARKADEALELFKAMKLQRIWPSSVTYGAVINACTRVGDGESAETLFKEMMSQRNMRLGVPPINTMMQFHVSTQPNREKVLHYYKVLLDNRLRPTSHTYKILLDAFATLAPANIEEVQRVFDGIVADYNVRVQGTHWASLISAYGQSANDVPAALAAFENSGNHPQASINLASEPVVWEAILAVLADRGTVEQMEEMRARMVQTGARSTAYVYNVLIRGYARAGMIERAREIFESMGDSVEGVAAPNNHPQLLTSSGHLKPSTVSPRTNVVYREPSTYESMIRAEVESGSREKAEEVVRRMEVRRYPVAVFLRARAALDEAADLHAKEAAVTEKSALGNAGSHTLPAFQPRIFVGEQQGVYDPNDDGSGDILKRPLVQPAEQPAEVAAEGYAVSTEVEGAEQKQSEETTTTTTGASAQ